MWDFITENNPFLSTLTFAVAGFFAFMRWLDTRNRQIKEDRYSKYMNLISVISGKRSDGSTVSLTEEIAAVWFLMEYTEYYKITKKIFSNSDFNNMANPSWVEHVYPQIQMMLTEVSKNEK